MSISQGTLITEKSAASDRIPSVSTHIAMEMVLIDETNNGWRHLALPIAQIDSLVMDSLLAAAESHLSLNVYRNRGNRAITFYTRAISQLPIRYSLECWTVQFGKFHLLALLILLTFVMINGWRDFPQLFKMLEDAVAIIGGEAKLGDDELAAFLRREIKK